MASSPVAAPGPARVVAGVCVAALAYGTAVHVGYLVRGGLDPYPGLPWWLSAYFVLLTVLDPVAGLLLWRRRRLGLVLACSVLVSDAVANGYANYVLDTAAGITPGRLGQATITVLAGALTVAGPWPWPAYTPRSSPGGGHAEAG